MKLFLYLTIVLLSFSSCQESKDLQRTSNFNQDWRFSLTAGDNSYSTDLIDTSWRVLNLPHDWSVEFPFDSIHGEGCTGYLPGGIGWYRKHFVLKTEAHHKVYVLFDGIYNHSEVWLNDHKIGEHPYGYSPIYYDLTPWLNPSGTDNVLAVRVDRSRYVDSRWYPGSGIYRNVQLITVGDMYVPIWGTCITTPDVSAEKAKVKIVVQVQNELDKIQDFDLLTKIIDPDGKNVLELKREKQSVNTGVAEFIKEGEIDHPKLWSVDHPQLYRAETSVIRNGEVVDRYTTTFGIRTIRFDAEKGFFLNGENMKIKGVCLHHDGGLVGAAVPKGVWERRLKTLKEGGCNAIRVSHNPASEEFLDLCDEMGFLVQDEFFDEWDNPKDKRNNCEEKHDDYASRGLSTYFQEWAEKDLKNTMMAHRNHPSVFQWSIGNEIEWTYPKNRIATGYFDNMSWNGNYFWSPPPYSPERIKEEYYKLPEEKYEIGSTAKKLATWTRQMDRTRPVIANCILPSVSFISGYADVLDIVGFSYRRVMYDYAHKNYPGKVIMGTENVTQWHEWKAIEERPFVSGTFLWTGIDYMGEATGGWPKKGVSSGLLDLAGFEKPAWHMFKTLWSNDPHIYLCTQTVEKSQFKVDKAGKVIEKKPGSWANLLWEWTPLNEHWNYTEGEPVIAEVISNCLQVELFLNDHSLGTKKLEDFPDHIYKWALPFSKGKLSAKGLTGNNIVETQIITSGEPVAIRLNIDKKSLMNDGQDVAHVMAQLVDKDGNPVKNMEKEIRFDVQGTIKSLGVDNGSIVNIQKYQTNKIKTFNGRALLVFQSLYEAGAATVAVAGDGLTGESVKIITNEMK